MTWLRAASPLPTHPSPGRPVHLRAVDAASSRRSALRASGDPGGLRGDPPSPPSPPPRAGRYLRGQALLLVVLAAQDPPQLVHGRTPAAGRPSATPQTRTRTPQIAAGSLERPLPAPQCGAPPPGTERLRTASARPRDSGRAGSSCPGEQPGGSASGDTRLSGVNGRWPFHLPREGTARAAGQHPGRCHLVLGLQRRHPGRAPVRVPAGEDGPAGLRETSGSAQL